MNLDSGHCAHSCKSKWRDSGVQSVTDVTCLSLAIFKYLDCSPLRDAGELSSCLLCRMEDEPFVGRDLRGQRQFTLLEPDLEQRQACRDCAIRLCTFIHSFIHSRLLLLCQHSRGPWRGWGGLHNELEWDAA